ncbi:MAG: hypothetical protein ETSY2_47060 [Candidatus Entotheonella gemina]|uniref:Uncharacterized protein n=1 Tax=Candidatus Entotheonella gemina TaxID=1429439 RepID=W4LEF3_9BACT|nr:MAG: hypothetical protein ETSY2_47060 [Candidatus Entotheonella gemina]
MRQPTVMLIRRTMKPWLKSFIAMTASASGGLGAEPVWRPD